MGGSLNRRRLLLHHAVGCTFAIATAVSLATCVRAQDVVVASSSTDPAARIKKQGRILDYTGFELTLKTTFGTTERIPAARVVEVQTAWTPSHQAGTAARAEGKIDEAIAALREARGEEMRPWAVRRIMADLAGTFLEAGRIDSAGDEFLGIVASDPATIHFGVIPIAWRARNLDAQAQARAGAWLADGQSPVARLLGASWLLGAEGDGEAQAAIKGLLESKDRRIAGLARILWWRSRLSAASTGEVEEWPEQLLKLPPEIQAAGWFVVGDARAQLDDPKRAAIAYLKVPLVFRQQRAMAADALLVAGVQLEKMGQASQAAGLYRELLRDFAHLPAAAEARERLEKPMAKP